MAIKNLKIKNIILILLCNIISLNIYAQCNYADDSDAPEELFRKRVKEPGMRYGNPYTMFVRDENFNLNTTLEQIRLNLTSSVLDEDKFRINSYADLYKGIFTMAKGGEPAKCPELQEVEDCMHPAWVKNNAIVYLIGLRYDTTALGKDTLILMDQAERDIYFNRAHQGLRDLNPNVNTCSWGSIGECGKVRNKAQQLVFYLQAYDLLKAGGGIPRYDKDRNGGSCTARNKLRQFARNLYRQSNSIINSTSGWKKNHGIICASAIGMAAIVLNDAGTETNVLKGNFLFKFFGGVGHNPTYSPINWYERAHGTGGGEDNIFGLVQWGEDGIEDNFFIGDHGYAFDDVPMTSPDGTAGYAEASSYFNDLASAWFPYIRSAANFLPANNPKNYLAQQKYKNLLDWYVKIQNSDHTLPSYDNSYIDKGNIIGILGGEYKSPAAYIPAGAEDLRGDYILAMGEGIINKLEPYYYNESSGNIILRNENINSKHTFHMLAEKGFALDPQSGNEDIHEDDDMGSFLIYSANKEGSAVPLAVDPPYFNSSLSNVTNKYWMHNTIEIDDGLPANTREYINPKYHLIDDGKFSNIQQFNLVFDFKSYVGTFSSPALFGSAITRNVSAINNSDNFYYFMNDYVDVHDIGDKVDDFQYIKLNLNGNGNKDLDDESSTSIPKLKSYRKEGNLHRWTYPCSASQGSWSLTAHVSALGNNISPYWEDPYTKTSYVPSEYDQSSMGQGVCNGTLTRLRIHQSVKKTIFQSFLYPQKCNWDLPTVTKDETANHVTTTIRFINGVDTSIQAKFGKSNFPKYINDTASHFHFARWQGGIADSVTNPFNLPATASKKLYLNAQKAFLKNNTYGWFLKGIKYCQSSSINLRHVDFTNGSYLIYGTDTLIQSTQMVNASISFASRQNYYCSIKPLTTPTSADSVKFYLADVERGIDMIALIKGSQDTLPSRYDSIHKNYTSVSI